MKINVDKSNLYLSVLNGAMIKEKSTSIISPQNRCRGLGEW